MVVEPSIYIAFMQGWQRFSEYSRDLTDSRACLREFAQWPGVSNWWCMLMPVTYFYSHLLGRPSFSTCFMSICPHFIEIKKRKIASFFPEGLVMVSMQEYKTEQRRRIRSGVFLKLYFYSFRLIFKMKVNFCLKKKLFSKFNWNRTFFWYCLHYSNKKIERI